MDEQVNFQLVRGEQGGHRVDQERHVVRDDLQDGARLLFVGRADRELELARQPDRGEFPVR
jgi:hypothetical protein